ncbi:MAG: hypothetical protein Q9159_001759 [Coniocarpon cinnabarinum]
MIYRFALCDQRIHIKPDGWNLTSQVCVDPLQTPITPSSKTLCDPCTVIKRSQQVHVHSLLVSRSNDSPALISIPPLGISLTRSCKAIFEETAPLVYRHNTFLIHSLGGLFRFVQMLPPRHLALIKELWVSNAMNGGEFSRASYGEGGMQKPRMDLGMLWCMNNLSAGMGCGDGELEAESLKEEEKKNNDLCEGLQSEVARVAEMGA